MKSTTNLNSKTTTKALPKRRPLAKKPATKRSAPRGK